MAALENTHTLLQHLSKMHGLPAEERLESRSNTFQANALTIRPEALSSRGGLKFSTPTTTITSRHYRPSCSGSQREGRMPSFTAVCFHSSSPQQVPGLVASPKCQWRSSVASTLHQTRICLQRFDSDKLCSNILPESQLFALLPLYSKSALLDDPQNIRSSKD